MQALKVVKSKPSQKRNWKIRAEIFKGKRKEVRKRAYTTINNAIVGTTRWLLLDGCVGTVVAIYHVETGVQIGAIKMDSHGKIKTWWDVWE